MTFGKLKRKIEKLNEIIKLPTGDYSEDDDKLINEIIIEFREFMRYLSQENRDAFEISAKNYKNSLNDLINSINSFIPFIQHRYNEEQFKKINKRGSAWQQKKY